MCPLFRRALTLPGSFQAAQRYYNIFLCRVLYPRDADGSVTGLDEVRTIAPQDALCMQTHNFFQALEDPAYTSLARFSFFVSLLIIVNGKMLFVPQFFLGHEPP